MLSMDLVQDFCHGVSRMIWVHMFTRFVLVQWTLKLDKVRKMMSHGWQKEFLIFLILWLGVSPHITKETKISIRRQY